MHIPDGILSAPILGGFGLASSLGVLISAKRAESSTQPHRLPLLGVLGAFVFAAQMVNFPVGPGASGHLLGGALLAASIGPWAASITMTAILILQALLFQDGGVLALAANVFNMAFLGVWAAWLPFRSLSNKSLGLFLGAFLSVLLSALFALAEVSFSSGVLTRGLWLFCLALFTITGLIEATITLAAWQAIERLAGRSTTNPKPLRYALLSLSVVILFTGVFFASSAPDVLEYFQHQSGIAPSSAPFPSLMPDYEWALFDLNWLRKSAASLAGLLAVFGLSVLISRFVPRGQQ
ncbi:MAG: energy-coupling factor ABC transporter permease [Acidobacteriota bacterium]